MLRLALCIAMSISLSGLMAQFGQSDTVRLLNGKRKLEPYQNTLKADFGFDARRTFLQDQWVQVAGLRAGVEYRRIHRFGVGFYFLNNRFFSRDFGFEIDESLVEYELGYTALYYERVLFFDRKWLIAAGLQLGGGNVDVYFNPGGLNDRVKHTEVPFSTAEFSAFVDYNITYWLSVGAGAGYRVVGRVPDEIRESFSGPIALVNVQVKLFKLARSIFDPEVKNEF